jgi:putative FmdB family regulatory protein
LPLYEYRCPQCGTFERMQKFSDPVLTACPTCENPVEKLLSAPAIQFKGSGWYVTDYAGKGKDKDKGKDEGKDTGPGEAKAKGASGGRDSGSSKTKETRKESSSSGKTNKSTSSK